MSKLWRWFAAPGLALAMAACGPIPPPPVKGPPPGQDVYRVAARRFAAIVVSRIRISTDGLEAGSADVPMPMAVPPHRWHLTGIS